MTETTHDPRGICERNHFLIRRLHSLCGIVPVGVFLCIHLTVNWTIVVGPDKFQFAVDGIHSLDKLGLLTAVEVFGIFVPIAFHAILGVQIWLSGRQNVLAYRYGGSIRYTLQRWTALIALAFLLYHLWHMHWLGALLPGGNNFDPHDAAATATTAIQASGWHAWAYAVGLLASVFHFSNGIWTFLITWGVTISRSAQRRAGYACTAVGFVLAAAGLTSLVVLRAADPGQYRTQPANPVHTAQVTSNLPG